MSELSEKRRDHMQKGAFAFPDQRKEPLNDADRAVYGVRQVMTCNERLAIDTLLISDALFR